MLSLKVYYESCGQDKAEGGRRVTALTLQGDGQTQGHLLSPILATSQHTLLSGRQSISTLKQVIKIFGLMVNTTGLWAGQGDPALWVGQRPMTRQRKPNISPRHDHCVQHYR